MLSSLLVAHSSRRSLRRVLRPVSRLRLLCVLCPTYAALKSVVQGLPAPRINQYAHATDRVQDAEAEVCMHMRVWNLARCNVFLQLFLDERVSSTFLSRVVAHLFSSTFLD